MHLCRRHVVVLLPWLILLSQLHPAMRAGPSDGAVVKSRPPPFFFGLIWSLIVIVLSVIWYYVAQPEKPTSRHCCAHGLLGLTVALCLLWLWVYHRPRTGVRNAVYVMWALVGTLALLAAVVTRLDIKYSELLAVPIVWALYAAVMNMFAAQAE